MTMTRNRFVHYTTGHADMDAQHWELFGKMDALVDQLKTKNYSSVDQTLVELCELLTEHVKMEDELMRSINYPYINAHRAAHRDQLDIMCNLEKRITNKASGFLSDVHISNLEELFVKHVDEHDMQLVHYARSNKL